MRDRLDKDENWVKKKVKLFKEKREENPNSRFVKKYALTKEEKLAIHMSTFMKFKIMRIRAKLSFSAFIHKWTVHELIMK